MYKRLLSAKCVYVIHWWLDCRPGWSKDATWTASKKLCKVCLPCHRSWRDPEPSCYWHPPTQCTSPHVCSLDAAFVKASSLPTFLQQLPKHWLVLICNVETVFVCQSLCFALKKLGFHSTAPVACVLWHDSVPKLRTNTNILCICLLQGRCPSHLNIPCCKLRNWSRSVLPNTSIFAGFKWLITILLVICRLKVQYSACKCIYMLSAFIFFYYLDSKIAKINCLW